MKWLWKKIVESYLRGIAEDAAKDGEFDFEEVVLRPTILGQKLEIGVFVRPMRGDSG